MPVSNKKYDVFISFRGEDTRKTFTANLYDALCEKKIESYIDYKLDKGDSIGPALAEAIEDSLMSLVIFSKDYATSKWCLDELLHILKCREHHGQVVIPVFYDVDPSHVRHQKESYEVAFGRYEGDLALADKVSEWRTALTLAANLSGWDSSKSKDDSQLIKNVVKDVWKKLCHMYPNELKDIIKTDENSDNIEQLMKTVPRIGIWGMSGIGKTTIAIQMFANNFAHYDNVCFLENVSEQVEKSGLISVRHKLLSELLKQEITASDVHGLHTLIKRKLNGKKSFIVLDDVDNATQLDDLCRVLGDLGPNSRLIITTRDRHTLGGKVDEIYEVKKWELKDSLKLFSLRAFKQDHPLEGYEHVSERAVECAGGLPLALQVLGSHFHDKDVEFWENQLNWYEKKGESIPGIQKVLRVSYNGLSWRQKEMFLDIAFFFKGENKDFVTRILDAFGFNATSGIEILGDKALISISKNSRIQMHDLLQKMAFDMVQEEYNESGKCSRLRDAKDISDVLGNNMGNDAIEGIIFDLSQKLDIHVQADTFNLMTKLRFLKFHIPSDKKKLGTVHLPENIMPFFKKLTYLEWNGYPLKSLPQPFRAEQLIQICLPHSNIEYLWYGKQELVNLEVIDLSECKQLISLPDLSRAIKLNQLRLSGCEKLREVQASAFSMDTLDTLLLDRCTQLESLMGEKHIASLENFSVKGCLSLKKFSLSSDSIKRLDLSNTGIKTLHPSIGDMNKLRSLNLEGLNLTNLPIELSRLKSLTELRVSKCSVVTKLKLEALFDGLGSLTLLHLKDCCNLIELPANISSLSSLYELRVDGSSVEELPASIKYLSKLEVQSLDNCSKLRCVPELPSSLKEFQADNCTSLMKVFTLKTFSINMIGQKKYISFKNSIKLESDDSLLDRITEDVILTMKSSAFHNVLVRKYRHQTHSYNYNSAVVCLPGHRVPRQFQHRSTTNSSVTINISNSFGFILAVVVSPSNRPQHHGYFVGIQCQCYSEDGGRKVGYMSSWHHKQITNLNVDHVFAWYDPYHSDQILSSSERKISFEFHIESYTSSWKELDGVLSIKECGVCLIHYYESQSVLGTVNLNKDFASELCEEIQIQSRSLEGYDEGDDEKEGTGIPNQQSDLNENCHSSYECLIEPASGMVEPEANLDIEESSAGKVRQKNTSKPAKGFSSFFSIDKLHLSSFLKVSKIQSKSNAVRRSNKNVKNSTEVVKSKGNKGMLIEHDDTLPEFVGLQSKSIDEDNESIGSSNKETNTNARTSHEENVGNSAKVFKSKGNEGRPAESEAALPLLLLPVVEENASVNNTSENNNDRQDNFDETQNPKETHIQGGQTVVPDIGDLISEPNQENENASIMDLSKPENGSDEDPFAEVESILFGSPQSTPKATCSTSDVSVREALHNLKCLLENSLESILSDVELQRQLNMSLECLQQASHENVSLNVWRLVQKMTSSIENLFKDFLVTKKVVEDHSNALQQKEKLMQRVIDGKKQKESMKKEKSQFEEEVKRLEEEGEKVDEKIQILVEQKNSIELEKTKLKESMEKCEGEKKKVEDEAKNMIAESKELMRSIKNSKSSYLASLSKQQKLRDEWEGFRISFSDNYGSSSS